MSLFDWLGGPAGPLHQIHGHLSTKMSENAGFITVETYIQGKTIENQFSYMGKNVKQIYNFWLFDVPWGALGSHQESEVLSSYYSANIYVHVHVK